MKYSQNFKLNATFLLMFFQNKQKGWVIDVFCDSK